MRYRVDGTVDPDFRTSDERDMLTACGSDALPNPRGADSSATRCY